MVSIFYLDIYGFTYGFRSGVRAGDTTLASDYGCFRFRGGISGNIVNVVNTGYRFPISTIEIVSYNMKGQHPTQKPVALFEYLIKTYTNEGDIVLDNCIGSGTTAIACKRLGRHYIGYEINKEYYKIAKTRLETEKTLWD